MLDAASLALVVGAGVLGGAVNAVAGGGSLITFPTLVAVGLSPVSANVTNTLAMCPGWIGAGLAQRRGLAGQGRRAALLLPVAALGGIAGALILLHTSARAFETAVPFLILLAAGLVGLADPLRAWLLGRTHPARAELLAAVPVGAAAVYGGYFGAGMGVMLIAALGIVLTDGIARLNAIKQVVSLVVNLAAAVVFIALGPVHWLAAGVLACGTLVGGAIGGTLAARVPARVLRAGIVAIGVIVATVYLLRL